MELESEYQGGIGIGVGAGTIRNRPSLISMIVHDCNRLSAPTRFLQTGYTTESCSDGLAQLRV